MIYVMRNSIKNLLYQRNILDEQLIQWYIVNLYKIILSL
jgi:hypothetical protein